MNDVNPYKVGFKTRTQVVLFEHELKGQISDGMWENSRPYDHWKIPCKAAAFVAKDDSELGKNFFSRKYNFANDDLVDCVSQRMINLVKVSCAFPDLKDDEIFNLDNNIETELSNWAKYVGSGNLFNEYWATRINSIYNLFFTKTNTYQKMVEELIPFLQTHFDSVDYALKDLRKDLKEMTKIWNGTYNK